jgi:hypothetical protein
MMAKDLVGVIALKKLADISHPVTNALINSHSLHYNLLNYLRMRCGHSMIEEFH